tara:strand:- start:13265 stop:13558 length:294 start_codon:yes stop_codon:yes gene_type:complete
MAKRKTPKVKKPVEKKITPQEARQTFMDGIAKDVGDLRDEILKDNEHLAVKLDMYAILYKNLLLEHYKTLNINYTPDKKEDKKESVILDKDGNPAKK